MRTEVPDYFEETSLTSEPYVQVDENLSARIAKMWLSDGINLVHTDPSGLQIMAQVSDGRIVGYAACDAQHNPLIIAVGEQRATLNSRSAVRVLDLHGKVLRTYLMPTPRRAS